MLTPVAQSSLYPDHPYYPALMPAQLDHYARDGYITGLPVFDASGVRRNQQLFDHLLSQFSGDNAYAINCYQARSQGIWDLCNHPLILDYVQCLLGPDIICWASHFFCKQPFDSKVVPWHQDAVYWHLQPTQTVTVWLAIDDVDEENAAMQFLPGTHRQGTLEWQTLSDEQRSDAVLDKAITDISTLSLPVSNTLKAGEISLHADMLAHGSPANQSARRRCGLTIRYCPPTVRTTDQRWYQGLEPIICRGSDTSHYWQHHERPVSDDLKRYVKPQNLGGN